MESVAALPWNGRQLSSGISGRIRVESVAGLPWNTHLFWVQLLFGLFEGLFGQVALLAKALEFLSQVAILLGAFFGLLLPLLAAVSEFGLLAHQVPPAQGPSPGRWTLWNPADQDNAAQGAMHYKSKGGTEAEMSTW